MSASVSAWLVNIINKKTKLDKNHTPPKKNNKIESRKSLRQTAGRSSPSLTLTQATWTHMLTFTYTSGTICRATVSLLSLNMPSAS